ncbi:S41 family peptidase [Pseudoalteromonas umbrosa]|uniref:S41 family peptidase n=1 Tax=Pseudoalteromonas umbrosa TaxID=3048489 RepID=UPI0024C2C856|nr:S41 family peptidase [Pseudoalteromonas sp. B95]MDK1288283.1 S41 family peptidase [Pseudoalteromonas sp. B95]
MKFKKRLSLKLISTVLFLSSNSVFATLDHQVKVSDKEQRLINDIAEFTELVHRVRYFYPSKTNESTAWEYFLKSSIQTLLNQPEENRLEHGLTLLKSITPLIEREANSLPKLNDNYKLHHWINFGPRNFNFYFRSIFEADPLYIPAPETQIYSDSYNGKPLYWPLFIRTEDLYLGTAYEANEGKVSLEDTATCMAAISSIWGEIQHFWPYFHQVNVDWQSSHLALLKGCLGDIEQLEQIIQIEFTKLQDNHVWVGVPREYRESNYYQLPLRLDHIENKAIVTNKTPYLTLQADIGDELLSIDNTSVSKLVEGYKKRTFKSAHRETIEATRILPLLYDGPKLVDLEFKKPDGSTYTTSTASIHHEVIGPFERPKKERSIINQLGDGLTIFRPQNLTTQKELQTVKQVLADSKGVVLDMRGYPANLMLTNQALGMFTDKQLMLGEFSFFIQFLPNREQAFKAEQVRPTPATPKLFDVPVVAITGRNNQSAAEHMMQWVQSIGIPILGEVTSGINGEHIHAQIFGGHANGGLSFRYTGALANQLDGSKFIGVGIQPDVNVPITQKSIQNNIDIQLNEAIALIKMML